MYLAHISKDKKRKQSLKAHLEGTAERAGDFASVFSCREWGYGCGLFHDIGKYTKSFQHRLHGGPMTDHTTAGAKEMLRRKNYIAAYCISGHHSGLLNGGTVGDSGGVATLYGRINKNVDDYQDFSQEIELSTFPPPPLRSIGEGGFSLAFFTKMLFSCLVDADFLDTEAFMSDEAVPRGNDDSMEQLFEHLLNHINPWLKNTDLNTVNGRRSAILKACLEKGKGVQGLYQLTVPTGGGKTISSLAFALQHAIEHNLERIVYVIPYTSIIDQNAQVFKAILGDGNVLEHHSNVVYKDEEELKRCQLAAENWDKKLIVTTNVQFFDSIFSNRTSKCRKLHNMAKSVIIFDEVQMLPINYLKPCVRSMSELVYNYNSTVVLCTATQPSLENLFPPQLKAVEICPDIKGQFDFFKRTNIRNAGEITEDVLVKSLQNQSQVLCILNNRKLVQRIYNALAGEGTYHLSTFMYPADRKKQLKEIKKRLEGGKVCRVISTSLVEAGVDFDFMKVYRQLAGIDSIIQADGRCNREGKRDIEECETVVFSLPDTAGTQLPSALRLPIETAKQVLRKYKDISSQEAIQEYFTLLYHYKGEESLDASDIVGQLERGAGSQIFPFADIAAQFHIIEKTTKTILIDVEPEAQGITARLRRGEHSRQLLRDAGQYSINVYQQDFDLLQGAGLLERLDEEIYLLRDRKLYTKDKGLVVDIERGDALHY